MYTGHKCHSLPLFQDVKQVGDNFTTFYCIKTMGGNNCPIYIIWLFLDINSDDVGPMKQKAKTESNNESSLS
jgi:hypothetical protein